jgi:hypothetical protein
VAKKKVKDEEPEKDSPKYNVKDISVKDGLAAFVRACKNSPTQFTLRGAGESSLVFGGKQVKFYPDNRTAEELPPTEAVEKFMKAQEGG